jgi:casein kinase II subunit alpha
MKIFNNINLLKQTKFLHNINVKNITNINLSINHKNNFNKNNKINNNSFVYTTKNFSSKTSHHKFDPFENININYGKHDDYEVLNRLGSGKYSQVYEGINIVKDKNVVIKVIKPVKYKKIRREVTILNILKGHENIVTLLDVIVDSSSRTPSFVFERINHMDFRTLFPKLSSTEIKYYIYCILKALSFAHSKGVMHRDIKPHNIIIDPHKKILKIIDWGLAEIYKQNTDYSVRVASRYFKSPELLLDNGLYDYSLDLWSLGCLFAGLIFKKDPFFHGSDNFDQLIKIVKVLGSNDLFTYVDKYDLKLNDGYTGLVEK